MTISLGLGGSLALAGDLPASLAVYNEMLLYYPRDYDAISKKAEVLSMLDRPKEALQEYQHLLDIGEESPLIRIRTGGIFFMERSFISALAEFEIALETLQFSNRKNNKIGDNDKGTKGVTTKNRKKKKDRSEDRSEDSKYMSAEDKATYILIIHRIGKCYKEFGDPKSLVYFNRALDMDPGSKEILMDIAAVLMEQGREERRVEEMRKAFKIFVDCLF